MYRSVPSAVSSAVSPAVSPAARLAIALAILIAPGAAGCGCGGGGGDCEGNADCLAGEYCDPATLTCVGIDSGPPAADSSMPSDSGPLDAGTDSGTACTDADGDGFTSCAGDCDDADGFTYPGAPEICGDGVTNDCGSGATPDDGCGGLGTFVAPPPAGDPANPGTQAAPVDTIAQGILNAVTLGGGAAVYVAAGTYLEDVLMVEGVSVYGGYESAGWTRSPGANVSIITAVGSAGVEFLSGTTRVTELDGFTVNGAAANGGAGAAVTVYDGAEPTISGNVINAPGTGGASYGVYINPAGVTNSASPLVSGNAVILGGSAAGWAGGGSWGISANDTPAEIVYNAITLVADDSVERGIEAIPGAPGLLIQGNTVMGPPGGSSDWAFAIRVSNGEAVLDSNAVATGSCLTYCAGITVGQGISAVITNNAAFGGMGPISYGFVIEVEAVPATTPDILVHSNYFDGGGMPPSGPGSLPLSAGVHLGEMPATPLVLGRFYDNIIYSGIGAIRYAFHEGHPNVDPDFLDSNALHVETSPAAFMSALYLDEGVNPLTTPSQVDAAGATAGANNLEDSCMVAVPSPGGDFHLLAGSACIDAGNAAELPPFDFEGDPRPAGAGPDIGVDETP